MPDVRPSARPTARHGVDIILEGNIRANHCTQIIDLHPSAPPARAGRPRQRRERHMVTPPPANSRPFDELRAGGRWAINYQPCAIRLPRELQTARARQDRADQGQARSGSGHPSIVMPNQAAQAWDRQIGTGPGASHNARTRSLSRGQTRRPGQTDRAGQGQTDQGQDRSEPGRPGQPGQGQTGPGHQAQSQDMGQRGPGRDGRAG